MANSCQHIQMQQDYRLANMTMEIKTFNQYQKKTKHFKTIQDPTSQVGACLPQQCFALSDQCLLVANQKVVSQHYKMILQSGTAHIIERVLEQTIL